MKRTQRAVSFVNAIGIDVEFCAGRGILEVVFPAPFGHPWSLYIGKRIGFVRYVLFSHPFVANLLRMSPDQIHRGTLGQERFCVHFHAADRCLVGTAPIEVQPAILIQEQVGIPEGKSRRDFLESIGSGIFRAVIAADLTVGRGEVKPVSHRTHIRSIVVDGHLTDEGTKFPVCQILAGEESGSHGGKEKIASLEADQRGIRGFPVVWVSFFAQLVFVGEIHGITVVFHNTFASNVVSQIRVGVGMFFLWDPGILKMDDNPGFAERLLQGRDGHLRNWTAFLNGHGSCNTGCLPGKYRGRDHP